MRKLSLIIVVVLLCLTAAFMYMKQPESVTNWTLNNRFYVHTTTNTLAHIVEYIGGGDVGVLPIVGSNIEPHDYEPTANDILTGLSSDLFIMNGAGFDAWAQTIIDQREAEGKPSVVVLDPVATDPHFWLDPISVMDVILRIRDAYIAIDPEHAAQYTTNAESYISELTELDTEYRARLVDCEKPEIVVAHDAFRYLADRYGFTVHAVTGISPDEEPSPADLARLTDLIENNGLDVVFFEETASDGIARVLAEETGSTTEVLYTLEVIPSDESYVSLMRANLEKLASAMICR